MILSTNLRNQNSRNAFDQVATKGMVCWTEVHHTFQETVFLKFISGKFISGLLMNVSTRRILVCMYVRIFYATASRFIYLIWLILEGHNMVPERTELNPLPLICSVPKKANSWNHNFLIHQIRLVHILQTDSNNRMDFLCLWHQD